MRSSDTVVRLIGVFKLVKASALVALGLGAFRLMHGDAADHLRAWVHALRIDPRNPIVAKAVEKLGLADGRELEELGIGGLLYAGLFLIEGIGLVLRKVWAEYLTVVITTSFVPIEIYELVRQPSPAKGVLLAFNVAIVGYLVWRLRSDRHWPFTPQLAHG